MDDRTVIEVNGVKLEVDLRTARRVDTLRVGDRVKVLTKAYDGYAVSAGTIIGFEPFANLPTIIVAYLSKDYRSSDVKFCHFNAQSTDVEIVKAIDDDAVEIDKVNILANLDNEIAKKRDEITEIERKRQYFLDNFRAYWETVEREPVA